ncbi:Hypothetical protein FKW44_010747 [Caligus rogercresseyi]|uniref:Uncharacterized protein n=1 Tax=Caligus rogercresseyi TaxID=217165 RepID=A0A7T8HI24_CALRO|nr:Hypothetical protein FKW44_010747 [Caligus rogercresseyi]
MEVSPHDGHDCHQELGHDQLCQEEAPAAFQLNQIAQGQEREEIGELDEERTWTGTCVFR